MPETMSPDTGMDSLYGEGTAKPDKSPESVDEEEREEMANTAIVPMKVLQSGDGEPVKEGDEIVVQVDHVYSDDEVEIRYAPKKGGKGGEPSSDDEEIEKMDTESY